MACGDRGFLLDLDVLTAWVGANTARWDVENPLSVLGAEPTPVQIRDGASAAVSAIAAAMAAAEAVSPAARRVRAAQVGDWLADCVNEIASGADRVGCAPLATPSEPLLTPTRRWAGGVREHVQSAGVGWRRGRHGGGLAFEVARDGARWTITEHGGTTSDDALCGALIPAVAAALVLAAEDAGRTANSRESVEAVLRADAQAYAGAHSDG